MAYSGPSVRHRRPSNWHVPNKQPGLPDNGIGVRSSYRSSSAGSRTPDAGRRLSIHPCKISTAAIRSTAFARFSIDNSVSRNNRFASAEVSRSSHMCTGSRNRLRRSSANTCILSDCVPSNHLLQRRQVRTLVPPLQSLQALRRDPQRIRHRHPNPSRPHVEPQNPPRRPVGFSPFKTHTAIISTALSGGRCLSGNSRSRPPRAELKWLF